MKLLMTSFFFLVTLTMVVTPVSAAQRVALVIGNSDYENSPLINPVNDAKAIAQSLRKLNFKVIEKHNVGRKEFRKAVRSFGELLSEDSVGLFYYAGHGMQIEGENYLIPIGSDIASEDEVADEGVSANLILRKMETAANDMNIVVLDACRNNPFARSFRSGNSGLSRMDGPTGSIIAFSTAPGDVASDGSGDNGLYTEHLLKYLGKSGLSIEQVFKKVRINVRQQSSGEQIPWESSSLVRDFYFKKDRGLKSTTSRRASNEAELLFWTTVQGNPSIEMYRLYQEKYPQGDFIPIARLQISKLGGADKGREALVKAEYYYDNNDVDEAFRWYEKSSNMGNPMAMAALSKLYKNGWGTDVDEALSDKYGRQSFEHIRQMAESGNTKAQYYLGYMYNNALGIEQDYDKGIHWYKEAAEKDHTWAINNLGQIYHNGQGVDKDYDKAMYWYKKAADLGDATPLSNIAVMYRDGDGVDVDYDRAMQLFEKSAKKGVSSAMNNIGLMYDIGKGVAQDFDMAMRWYKKAAAKGFSDAMHNIAVLYKNGEGVSQDYEEAMRWFKKAVAKGDADAMKSIGSLYRDGKGVSKNTSEAIRWYKKAAENGNVSGMFSIGYMYHFGQGVDKDGDKALSWYKKAAAEGSTGSMANIAILYQKGELLPRNADKAIYWYKKQIEAGNTDGYYNIGYMYDNGEAVSKDYYEAIKWYKKAAAEGDKEAMGNIGYMYAQGNGVSQDYDQALEWYTKAADEGDGWSMKKIGEMYYRGRGVSEDNEEAVRWYRKAIDNGTDAESDLAAALNSAAWGYAVCKSYCDGELAVKYAKEATGIDSDPGYLDTLAAAYARNDQFYLAVETQERAISMLSDSKKIADYESRLGYYQDDEPYSD